MTTIYSFGEFDETPKTPTRKNTSKARWVQDENTLNAPFRGEPSESQVQSLKSQSMVSTTFPNMIGMFWNPWKRVILKPVLTFYVKKIAIVIWKI